MIFHRIWINRNYWNPCIFNKNHERSIRLSKHLFTRQKRLFFTSNFNEIKDC